MTNKEAQLALANLKRYISGGGAVDRNTNNAIDMAISALEMQEQVVDASCETCKYKNRSSNTYPCFGCFRAYDQDDYYEPYTEEDNDR